VSGVAGEPEDIVLRDRVLRPFAVRSVVWSTGTFRDLWVMSQPVAVSPGAVGLIAARQRRRAVQLVALCRGCFYGFRRVLCPNS
jgi:hypothetical protein